MRVLIVGGGFAGLKLARLLNNRPGFEITLLDRFNFHQFQPLFYQVATSSLDASNISFPLRKAFHGSRNVHIRMAELKKVNAADNKVVTEIGECEYDLLVLATGADTNFFGNSNLPEFAFPMKSTGEALQLRHRLIQNFEDALVATDELTRQKLLTVVIVGGGPTGVELGGAIGDMKRFVLSKDYPELDFSKMKIYLLEGSPRTLSSMSERSSEQSRRYLERLGVTVLTNTIAKEYDGERVILNNGDTIPSAMVIWAAGIKGNVPAGIDASLVAKGNRIKVDRFNKVEGTRNIYALGDLAYMETTLYPHGHPQVASVAIAQAAELGQNLLRLAKGKQQKEFEYHDKGSMATVGRNLAVVDIPKPKLHFGGLLAWLVWMSLHLFLIVGVKNRLFVFLNWVYNYITYDQSLRLIFREFYRERKKPVTLSQNQEPRSKNQEPKKEEEKIKLKRALDR
jgi:NADH dehydrogenase